MIRIEDTGEVAYGGLVTWTTWWDNKRIADGKIGSKDILKKASFYTYLAVGLGATVISAFGWMRRYDTWMEGISHGFFYDLPRFAYDLYKTQSAASGSNSAAVREAQRIVQQKQAQRQLGAGTPTHRSYQQEFRKAMVL